MSALRDELRIDELFARIDALTQEVRSLKTQSGPELLTVQQVADMCEKTPRTIARWIADGRFTVKRNGKTPLIPRDEVTPIVPQSRPQ
ncbi:helix-turn-helix domain-containing protein [Sulfitobacter sp. 20_GPM-1509m]|uniref:helix-turn-helix domain-containing protein n=1 Tax=Sulfitobacter sp. 20_GPM-1509m TaxID=1380367 RepID=UPI0012DEA15F|nr:helix-turn-helix domain-containing protein [Sulfitobacter sp. 20_GPM-1509m]